MAGQQHALQRLSSHPVDIPVTTSPAGSPGFTSPVSSTYASPQEEFMSARSNSFSSQRTGSLDRAFSAASRVLPDPAEQPDAPIIPPNSPRSDGGALPTPATLRYKYGIPQTTANGSGGGGSKTLMASTDLETGGFPAAPNGGILHPDYQIGGEDGVSQNPGSGVVRPDGQPWGFTVLTLLALQLGWGLWLLPYDFARLGWGGGTVTVLAVACGALYSARMYTRLKLRVSDAIIFGDVGAAAFGHAGRAACYLTVYALDATRCIILHLAATQSLQHVVQDSRLGLWAYGGIFAGAAWLVVQVQSLVRLTAFLTIGTTAGLTALGITLVKLAASADPNAHHDAFRLTSFAAGAEGAQRVETVIVAVMNIFFAFGGQFAFVEILTAMRRPSHFTRAASCSVAMLTAAYLSLGLVGYYSQGRNITADIFVFQFTGDAVMRTAAGALALQAMSQYLVNVNVWCHNILTLAARAFRSREASSKIQIAGDHGRIGWLLTTAFVISYSYAICVAVPFFSELVGLVTAATYLTVALTLPAAFSLRLLGKSQSRLDCAIQVLLIPASLCVSGVGTYASLQQLVSRLSQKY